MAKSHSDEIQRLIENSAAEGNILPITSRCDTHCIFCSHKNNPPDIDVISIGVRTIEEITRTMDFLDPVHVITIGESASSIIEGEPFTHPRFREILSALRNRFPRTPIAITTNGHFLNSETVDFIDGLGNISLNISLNSASAEGRKILMGNSPKQAEQTLAGIRMLAERGIAYDSSMVAMPHLTGWEEMRRTIRFLSDNKASVIRVFMPALTARTQKDFLPDGETIHAQLREFIEGLSADLYCPVLIEPSYVANLTAEISGVVRDSAAWAAGVRRGDVVRSVNGKMPRSRVEAWNMLGPRGAMEIVALKNGQEERFSWLNPLDGGSGIVMEYDFDMRRAETLRQLIQRQAGKSLLLASEFGHGVLRAVLDLVLPGDDRAEAVRVKNQTFGGTIRASGLLTVDDYHAAFKDWQALNREGPCQLLVPLESFNSLGFDLKHQHHLQLAGMTGVPVRLA